MGNPRKKKRDQDILWEFTEEFAKGRIPRIEDFLHAVEDNKQELLEDLIAAKISYLIAHPQLNIPDDEESLENLLKKLKTLITERRRKI